MQIIPKGPLEHTPCDLCKKLPQSANNSSIGSTFHRPVDWKSRQEYLQDEEITVVSVQRVVGQAHSVGEYMILSSFCSFLNISQVST